ncbi:MBL fold metallo-hydrolase [Radiobacillus kanasensis]|uniref:ComEC/Rec2 family competence protein n=1 Tax=Radiobacillus kanasensis TaxID=2844358 RepID=UPI001E56CAA8|nr:MBL fold metallo-hydrolase [Radiobacillus kanasensis]UFU00022.1 MBL fold metallo-hydrolase [Radiobacillus kanasensis]
MSEKSKLSFIMVSIVLLFIPRAPVSAMQASPEEYQQEVASTVVQSMGQLKVHFLDVGQGDSILIEAPNGKKVLIDGGRPSAGKTVVQYLKDNDIASLDLVISTHPDFDHIGGLVDVLRKVDVKKVIDSGKLYYTETYQKYVQVLNNKDLPVDIAKKNTKVDLGKDISVQILNTFQEFRTNNESSIVILLRYQETDFLLMGDVEKEQERKLIKKIPSDIEVLKVAHHGSDTASSLHFLQHISPEIAILSYGRNNPFGHPVDTVINNLHQVRANIYSTAKAGHIVISTKGEGYDIQISGRDRVVYQATS